MNDPIIHARVIDTLAIEAEARRLRAEFFADCFRALGRRIATLLDTSTAPEAQR